MTRTIYYITNIDMYVCVTYSVLSYVYTSYSVAQLAIFWRDARDSRPSLGMFQLGAIWGALKVMIPQCVVLCIGTW